MSTVLVTIPKVSGALKNRGDKMRFCIYTQLSFSHDRRVDVSIIYEPANACCTSVLGCFGKFTLNTI